MIEGALAGVVQGVTEFLPISSSGHLALLSQLFGFKEEGFHLTLALHAATLLSLLTVFRSSIFRGAAFWGKESRLLMAKAAWALTPLGAPFLFKDQIELSFQQTSAAAFGFLMTAAFLLPLFWVKEGNSPLTFKKALIIGAAQALAVWPGLSRSGATIAAGVFLGLSPIAAARFSFLIAAPAIALAAAAELASGGFNEALRGESLTRLSAAFLAAYISGTLSLQALLSFVRKGWLPFFSFYVILLGLGLFLFY